MPSVQRGIDGGINERIWHHMAEILCRGPTFGYRGDARGNMTYFKKDRTVKQSAISEITKDEFMATRPRSVNA